MSIQIFLLFTLIATATVVTTSHPHKHTHDTFVLPESLHFLWSWVDRRPLFMNKSLLKDDPLERCRILVSCFSELACGGTKCEQNRFIMYEICNLGLEMPRDEMLRRCC